MFFNQLKITILIENFTTIKYLKNGNKKQKEAYLDLKSNKVLELLAPFNPILTGTIPIGIDIPESDLDIICECKNHDDFSTFLKQKFSGYKDFNIYQTIQNTIPSTIATFKTENFLYEIFGQDIPTKNQNAYRHMLLENKILKEKGLQFKKDIITLKLKGFKTEPAFAKLLDLKGDPYKALLALENSNISFN
mgnify:CR=1 FL=1